MVVSLTTTPMMCAHLLKHHDRCSTGGFTASSETRLRLDSATCTADAARWCCGIRRSRCWLSAGHDRAERVSVRACAQGILPAAGHGPPDRARSRPIRTPRFRRMDAEGAAVRATIVMPDPAVDKRDRVHRRHGRRTNTGAHVHHAEAARRAQSRASIRSSRGCARSWRECPARRCSCRPSQDLRVGGRHEQRAISVHAAERQPCRI